MMSNTEVERALDDVIHAVAKVNRLLRDAGEALASSAGQTHSRRMVLQAVGEGASVADIARRLGMQRQGVQRIADELVHDGLGRYESNPHHKRAKLLKTTALGQERLREIETAHAQWLAELAAHTGRTSWAATHRDLEQLADTLEALRRTGR